MTHASSRNLGGRRLPFGWLAVGGTAAGVGLVAAAGGFGDDGPVLCPVRNLSGGYCPGCGLSRACGSLLRGDVVEAVALHPYLPVLLIQLVGLVGLTAFGSASTGRRLWNGLLPLTLANGSVLLGIWLIRLATGAIPVPFGG